MADYISRIVDRELDELLPSLPAVCLEGPKAVGKTETALRRAGTVYRLDDPAQRQVIEAEPARIREGELPILVDEWQRVPSTWDVLRRAVDEDSSAGRFLLTGSATPGQRPTHSGAGRIVTLRMRPLTLAERGMGTPTVNLRDLAGGERPPVEGRSEQSLGDYVNAILESGYPGLQHLEGRPLRAQLNGYQRRIVDVEFRQAGRDVRNPETLRRWMRAYAAATATTASYETIRDAATAGHGDKPAKTTTIPYREILEQIWILDPLPAWIPSRNYFSRLSRSPKHHLTDPALAARLLRIGRGGLLEGAEGGVAMPRDGTLLGHLFESLITLCMRVYAQSLEAEVSHFRLRGGRREVDLILERDDRRVVAMEVKLGRVVRDSDVEHLLWLGDRLGDDLMDSVVITTGPEAYRRPDGVAVVPAALLGP